MLCFCCETKSQVNLVPNGSFEDTISCPNTTGGLSNCKYWYDPNLCSSDYFNSCAPIFTDVSIPQNFAGFQNPRTGDAYGGFYVFVPFYTSSYREAIAVELNEVLKKDFVYCVKFYISLADSMYYAVNRISLAFTTTKYLDTTCNLDMINLTPQINSNGNYLTNKIEWLEISSTYKATGNERFVIISNFQNNSNLDTLFLNNGGQKNVNTIASYYYIDDVSITECGDLNINIPNVFTPNNDGINDIWEFVLNENLSCIVYNRWGNKIFETSKSVIKWDGRTTSGIECTDGIYFYSIETKEKTYKGFIQLLR